MPGFDWGEGTEDHDPLDGYDTDPNPSPEVVQQARTVTPKQVAARAAQAVQELTQPQEEESKYSEAEWRLEKAQFYRAILGNQLLGSDHPAAIEVEHELQDWAHEQLEVLLGMKQPGVVQTQIAPVSQFNETEVEALKLLAARVIGKTQAPSPVEPPKPVIPQPVVTPVRRPVERTVKPIQTEPQGRGRGRPRKYPCKQCGKMECEHKVKPNQQPTKPQESPTGEYFSGQPVGILPDGTKYIDAPNGIRYRLDKRIVTDAKGKEKEIIFPRELKSNIPKSPNAKPYPSEQEVMAIAAQEASANLNRVNKSAIANIRGVGTVTGQSVIQAALAAPEREEYIPTPPKRK